MTDSKAQCEHIASDADVDWQQFTHVMFTARYKSLSTAANAGRLGCTLVEVGPGK